MNGWGFHKQDSRVGVDTAVAPWALLEKLSYYFFCSWVTETLRDMDNQRAVNSREFDLLNRFPQAGAVKS